MSYADYTVEYVARRYAIVALIVLAVVALAWVLYFEDVKKREDRLVGYWIEHCVDQFRPKYQEGARRGCEEEAERWRYGTEKPFDWTGYEEAEDEAWERVRRDGGVKELKMKAQ